MIGLRRTRRRVVLVGILGAVVLLVAWLVRPQRPVAPTVHDDGGGILSASSGAGGQSIYPTPAPPWTASFGTFILCVRSSGERATITDVRSAVTGTPLRLRHVLRVVPAAAHRPDGFSWASYSSILGSFPGSGARPYGGSARPVEGAVISQTCSDAHERSSGYTDLLTELTVDRRGAAVRRTYVDYTSGGRRYTLVIRWEMTACGTVITEHCGN